MAETSNPFSQWMDDDVNPYMKLLGTAPEAAYHSYQTDWASPNQQQYYQNQFQNIYNQYLGSLGASLRQGAEGGEGAPTVKEAVSPTFTDYLGNYDWTNRYTSLPPTMRGDFTSQFNPRTRQIYF